MPSPLNYTGWGSNPFASYLTKMAEEAEQDSERESASMGKIFWVCGLLIRTLPGCDTLEWVCGHELLSWSQASIHHSWLGQKATKVASRVAS